MAKLPPAPKGRRSSRDEDQASYVGAWERLLAQNPDDNRLESLQLREMLEEQGHVPVTQDNVAMEAGLTRKALTAGGRFEELGRRIKAMRSSHGVAPSTTEELSELRKSLGEARQTIVVIRSKMAESILKTERAEVELAHEKGISLRLRQQLASAGRK